DRGEFKIPHMALLLHSPVPLQSHDSNLPGVRLALEDTATSPQELVGTQAQADRTPEVARATSLTEVAVRRGIFTRAGPVLIRTPGRAAVVAPPYSPKAYWQVVNGRKREGQARNLGLHHTPKALR